jgi:hypothetical protein
MTRYLFRTAALIAALLPALVAVPASADRELTHAVHRYFEYPAEIQTARLACFRTEREARGIPGDRPTYTVWFETNRGTAAWQDWRDAYQACKDNNALPGGPWNWSAMVEVQR